MLFRSRRVIASPNANSLTSQQPLWDTRHRVSSGRNSSLSGRRAPVASVSLRPPTVGSLGTPHLRVHYSSHPNRSPSEKSVVVGASETREFGRVRRRREQTPNPLHGMYFGISTCQTLGRSLKDVQYLLLISGSSIAPLQIPNLVSVFLLNLRVDHLLSVAHHGKVWVVGDQ